MRYVFFINPAAGKGKGPAQLVPAIEKYFKDSEFEYKIIITDAPGNAESMARAEAQTGAESTFFACGGDGTFFEVLNGAYGFSNVHLGVIPCGSGNDFLKFFDSAAQFSVIDDQINGRAVPMDVIRVGERCCINICSLGMDAVVADNMTIFKKWPLISGSLAYKLAIVKTFLGKLGQKIKITVDGKSLGTVDSLFAVCANGPVYGGGYKSSPSANPMDGRLEWLVVEKISRLKILKFLKLYEKGVHEDLPCCRHGHCSVMEIEAEKDEPINLDGEIIHCRKVRFELVKNAVSFVLPHGVYEKYAEQTKAAATV